MVVLKMLPEFMLVCMFFIKCPLLYSDIMTETSNTVPETKNPEREDMGLSLCSFTHSKLKIWEDHKYEETVLQKSAMIKDCSRVYFM